MQENAKHRSWKSQLWTILDQMRGRGVTDSLLAVLEKARADGIDIGPKELSSVLGGSRGGFAEHFVPTQIVTFIAKLLDGTPLDDVLDPWAGYGLMARQLLMKLPIGRLDALSATEDCVRLDRVLAGGEGPQWTVGHPPDLLDDLCRPYDAVLSIPPMGQPVTASVALDDEQMELRDSLGHILLLKACMLLKDHGTGVFVVSPSFVSPRRPRSVRSVLAQCGLRIAALLNVPAGSFGPTTRIEAALAIIERGAQEQVFVGEIPDTPEGQDTLVSNFRVREPGNRASQGRIVDLDTYRGFRQLEASEGVAALAERMGVDPVPASEVLAAINSPRGGREWEGFDDLPDCVYLPLTTRVPATASQEDLPERLRHYLQLVVDPAKAEPVYLAGWLNTALGNEVRDSVSAGGTMLRLSARALREAHFYLPSLDVQQAIVSGIGRIKTLSNELSELEEKLWQRPAAVKEVLECVDRVNHEDRFDDWLESLPFPLASILWAYDADTDSDKEKYERLLHFFEALAEFEAVVLLSAFVSGEALWATCQQQVADALQQQGLSFELGTFGTWRCVVGILAKRVRTMLNSGDERDACYSLFRTREMKVLSAICERKLQSVLQDTNALRNSWTGHTGAVSRQEAARRHATMQQHLTMVRQVFGNLWEKYELLLPGHCTVAAGPTYLYSAKRIMGTRTPFQNVEVELTEPMEDGHLHLCNQDERKALKLLPLVRVMPSPRTEENACYFYNRREGDEIRFLSYHFESDADVTQPFEDTALALKMLND